MSTPLCVLIVEDSEDDMILVVRALRRGGYDPTFERVDTPKAFVAALARQTWDIVIADYSLPHFSGLAALTLLKESGLDLPFIVVSGAIGEDVAVSAMKAGAHDYVMKDNLARLGPAVQRELHEAKVRLARRRAEEGQRKALAEALQATHALRESEERYRTLVTQAPIGVITSDRAGNVTHVNPAVLQVLGAFSEESVRQFNLLTMPSLIEAGIAADVRRCIEEATRIAAEYPYRSYGGKEIIVRLHLAPLRDEGGAVSGALILIEDVTEQRRLEEQLIQSDKLASIGELAAGVAHEVNNPINGIINYAQLLLNKVQAADETERGDRETRQTRQWLEGILREGDRVANIVRDLLTFARVEKEAHSPAHVSDIFRATLTLIGQQLRKDGISLEINEQPNLPQIKCRSQRIQQVFLNLISNARSALNACYPEEDPDKRLVVRIEQVEKEGQPYVRTTFQDYGVGISAHNLSHIFTPFFTTKRPDEGTGLGLSVSYGIVQDHHGDIQVESVEGEYTIFQVDLPVDPGWEDIV